jgi:hypothetical protein
MKYFVQRLNFNNWYVVSGPYGCENTAYIHAKNYAKRQSNSGQVRIVTNKGGVVNIL